MQLKLFFLSVLLILRTTAIDAQKIITLKECYEKAHAATPISAEDETYVAIWQIKDKNLSKGWLPEIDAGMETVMTRINSTNAQNNILNQQIDNLKVNIARVENMPEIETKV